MKIKRFATRGAALLLSAGLPLAVQAGPLTNVGAALGSVGPGVNRLVGSLPILGGLPAGRP